MKILVRSVFYLLPDKLRIPISSPALSKRPLKIRAGEKEVDKDVVITCCNRKNIQGSGIKGAILGHSSNLLPNNEFLGACPSQTY